MSPDSTTEELAQSSFSPELINSTIRLETDSKIPDRNDLRGSIERSLRDNFTILDESPEPGSSEEEQRTALEGINRAINIGVKYGVDESFGEHSPIRVVRELKAIEANHQQSKSPDEGPVWTDQAICRVLYGHLIGNLADNMTNVYAVQALEEMAQLRGLKPAELIARPEILSLLSQNRRDAAMEANYHTDQHLVKLGVAWDRANNRYTSQSTPSHSV